MCLINIIPVYLVTCSDVFVKTALHPLRDRIHTNCNLGLKCFDRNSYNFGTHVKYGKKIAKDKNTKRYPTMKKQQKRKARRLPYICWLSFQQM